MHIRLLGVKVQFSKPVLGPPGGLERREISLWLVLVKEGFRQQVAFGFCFEKWMEFTCGGKMGHSWSGAGGWKAPGEVRREWGEKSSFVR